MKFYQAIVFLMTCIMHSITMFGVGGLTSRNFYRLICLNRLLPTVDIKEHTKTFLENNSYYEQTAHVKPANLVLRTLILVPEKWRTLRYEISEITKEFFNTIHPFFKYYLIACGMYLAAFPVVFFAKRMKLITRPLLGRFTVSALSFFL